MAPPKTSKTETMNVTEARRNFSETLDRVRKGEARVILEKSGIPVGALISLEDVELLKRIDEERRLTMEAFAEARSGFEGIPSDEIDAEIEKAIDDVENEWRQRAQEEPEKKAS